MFKQYPAPIEDQLDELRDQMWQEAGGDEQKYVEMIKQLAREAAQKYDLTQSNGQTSDS